MTIRLLLLFASLGRGDGAAALEVGGVKLDDKASVGGQELVLNGAGVRKRAIFKVYVGEPVRARERRPRLRAVLAKGPRRIQMNLLRNLSADQLVDALSTASRRTTARRSCGRQGPDRRSWSPS